MKLTYTLTINDYKAALKLHYRQKFSRRFIYFACIWLAPITALLLILSYFLSPHGELSDGSIAMFAILLFCVLLPVMHYIEVQKQFNQLFPPTRTDRSSSINIDNERIVSGVPGVSESNIFWPGILAFAQNERITMIYLSENKFIFFPTSSLSSAQRTELNELVAQNMMRKDK
jgi:hypothetical protein